MDDYKSDICINKHKGNEQSKAANKTVRKQKDKNFIFDYIQQHGSGYSKEIARVMQKGLNTISGRFSELKEEGLIEPARNSQGEEYTLEGCKVYQIVKQQMRMVF